MEMTQKQIEIEFQSATQNIFNRINERIKLLKGESGYENDKV